MSKVGDTAVYAHGYSIIILIVDKKKKLVLLLILKEQPRVIISTRTALENNAACLPLAKMLGAS